MNAPLSRYLTRFQEAVPTPARPPESATGFAAEPAATPIAGEPTVTLTVAELEAQLEAARRDARDEATTRGDGEKTALCDAHRVDLGTAVEAARSAWADHDGGQTAARIDEAFASLRESLADGIAGVLRPLMAAELAARARAALADALDRLLDDGDRPPITVRGPSALIEAIRTARGDDAAITYDYADTVEVTVTADATRIETQLGAALAALAEEV